ncbi:band 3 anion transport protein isoform X2 [Agrilus planipennis]|uniref:Anion exchange protein n=1 Tax=Agrilus planipennis TaxID=224129 RepID=A0A1W4XTB2_AGRPL|nr:band 3 anion transport protein isoform X2 [Agrilus planipennis]
MRADTATSPTKVEKSFIRHAREKFLKLLRVIRRSHQTDNANDPNDTDARLDDECEKVFAMDSDVDRFDVAKLVDTPSSVDTAYPKVPEEDYELHRQKSYPHVHVPLKPSRSSRWRLGSPQDTPNGSTPSDTPTVTPGSPVSSTKTTTAASNNLGSLGSPVLRLNDSDIEDPGALSSESECILSDPTGYRSPPDMLDRKVQFVNGKVKEGEDEGEKKRSKKRHHHHHAQQHFKPRKYSLPVEASDKGDDSKRKISTQPEDLALKGTDRDQLDSHRSDDPKALRRHKTTRPSVVHIGRKDDYQFQTLMMKKEFDHVPHPIFVQLDELGADEEHSEETEWRETARWIKYEEDVEEGVDRWGRPHVASLSFHSLLNLRRCLEDGLVILDMEEKDLPAISYRITEELYKEDLIREADKAKIMRVLLLKHHHVNEHHERGFRFNKKQHSYTSLQSLWLESAVICEAVTMARCTTCATQGLLCPLHMQPSRGPFYFSNLHHDNEKRKASVSSDIHHGIKGNGGTITADGHLGIPNEKYTTVDIKEETYSTSNEDVSRKTSTSIIRKIPIDAQATSVLVGEVDFLEQPAIAFVRLAEGIIIPSFLEVNIPIRFMFILLGTKNFNLDYHEIGRSIATLMANQQFHDIAFEANNRKALLSAINEFLDDSIVLPPGDWERRALLPIEEIKAKSEQIKRRKQSALKKISTAEDTKVLLLSDGAGEKKPPFDDPLERTHRPFGGLIRDIKRRYPFYKSDCWQGLNAQCAAASIFIYFAALSGAIAFGGLLSDKTRNSIGTSETLVATALGGALFALLGGQPLVIVGTTGPLLLFEEALFKFCDSNGIEYLTIRVYIGLWLGIIGLFVACLEGSVFVRQFTRFTQEIFAALISLFFVMESIMKLINVFQRNPLLADYCHLGFLAAGEDGNSSLVPFDKQNVTLNTSSDDNQQCLTNPTWLLPSYDAKGPINQPNTALFCLVLTLGTFIIAYYLLKFRNGKFLGRSARRALGDFGVPIAIVIMVFLDYLVPQTYTDKLSLPEGLTPSNPEIRGWIINPAGQNGFPFWIVFAAGIPAMLVYILLFMETHICELIIAKPERKLKKGSGLHLDIVLICLINILCGLLGAPFMCAATVRSIAHVAAVTVMSRTHAPGEKPYIIEVKEQRVSAFAVGLLIGLSVLMAPLLRLVPMAVLFGVFLYMGIASTTGIQFFERCRLLFMPAKYHHQASYVRKVRTWKMHLFTAIQLSCLVFLWVIKETKASLAFPFFLILAVPLRGQILKFVFTPKELRALDGEQPDDDDDDEPDFYQQARLPG